MRYESFKELVIRNIKEYLPPEYSKWSVKVTRVEKINEGFDSLNLIPPGDEKGIYPNIYLELFYESYKCGIGFEVIMKEIAEILQVTADLPEVDMDMKNMIKDVIPTVINKEKNKILLESIPHREFLDLAIIYRITLEAPDGGVFGCSVNYDVLADMGISLDELAEIADENLNNKYPLVVRKINGMVHKSHVFVITNKACFMGAYGIVKNDLLKKIADECDEKLYIIPSSIHELIVVPESVAKNPETLRDKIGEVNSTHVNNDVWLSNNLYVYDNETDEVRIV